MHMYCLALVPNFHVHNSGVFHKTKMKYITMQVILQLCMYL